MAINDAYQKDARAVRNVLVSASGVIAKIVPIEEHRLGSECSGISGALGRVLTLNNTVESGGPIIVWVDGALMDPAVLTVNHLESSSTITFDLVNIDDSDKIRVIYHV